MLLDDNVFIVPNYFVRNVLVCLERIFGLFSREQASRHSLWKGKLEVFLCQNYSGGWTTPAGPYPRQEIIQGYFPRANWFSSSAYFFNTITRCPQIIEWISNILKPSSLISLWLAQIVWFYIISFPNKVINQLVDFFNLVFRYWDQRCFAQKFRDNKTQKTLYNLNFSYQGKAPTFPAI